MGLGTVKPIPTATSTTLLSVWSFWAKSPRRAVSGGLCGGRAYVLADEIGGHFDTVAFAGLLSESGGRFAVGRNVQHRADRRAYALWFSVFSQ
jgi:hypothetical protein